MPCLQVVVAALTVATAFLELLHLLAAEEEVRTGAMVALVALVAVEVQILRGM